MAGHSTFTIPNTSVALSASATKTLTLVTPATSSVDFVLTELCVSFDTSTAGTAIEVDLYRVVTIGSAAGTSATPVKSSGPDGGAALINATYTLTNLTTEPTTVAVIKPFFVPQSGLMLIQYPLGRESLASTATGLGIGLRVTTPAGITPHALAWLEIEF